MHRSGISQVLWCQNDPAIKDLDGLEVAAKELREELAAGEFFCGLIQGNQGLQMFLNIWRILAWDFNDDLVGTEGFNH